MRLSTRSSKLARARAKARGGPPDRFPRVIDLFKADRGFTPCLSMTTSIGRMRKDSCAAKVVDEFTQVYRELQSGCTTAVSKAIFMALPRADPGHALTIDHRSTK